MDELLSQYQDNIAAITFTPSSGGVFEVTLNGDLVFSKKQAGRFPEAGEVTKIIAGKQGWQ